MPSKAKRLGEQVMLRVSVSLCVPALGFGSNGEGRDQRPSRNQSNQSGETQREPETANTLGAVA